MSRERKTGKQSDGCQLAKGFRCLFFVVFMLIHVCIPNLLQNPFCLSLSGYNVFLSLYLLHNLLARLEFFGLFENNNNIY